MPAAGIALCMAAHIVLSRAGVRSQLWAIGLSIVVGLVGGGSLGWTFADAAARASGVDAAWAVALWITTYFTLVYCYLAGMFNPGESARRIRLLIELRTAGARGMTLDEIVSVYNAHAIIRARLDRLLAGGQIVEHDGRYFVGRRLMLTLAKVMVVFKVVLLGAKTEFEAKGSGSGTRGIAASTRD